MTVLDLRSDTVTKPSDDMRQAMMSAPVGDDVYREDPTVTKLEERIADITGKEAALFVPTGTMGNQLGIACQTRPGDEVVIGEGAHCAYYESGAAPVISGVQFEVAGRGGAFGGEELRAAVKPRAYYCPRTSLVVVENTLNRAGGTVFPLALVDEVAAVAAELGLGMHLDGARLWNAAVATGTTIASLCRPFDTVSICFSKGLGAPVGSALCGTRDHVSDALRMRKMLGGGMRQVGILAAGALFALDHHRDDLARDHEMAQRIATALRDVAGVSVAPVETNIINVDVDGDAVKLAERARGQGILFNPVGPMRVRLVTHRDVSGGDVARQVERLSSLFAEFLNAPSEVRG